MELWERQREYRESRLKQAEVRAKGVAVLKPRHIIKLRGIYEHQFRKSLGRIGVNEASELACSERLNAYMEYDGLTLIDLTPTRITPKRESAIIKYQIST